MRRRKRYSVRYPVANAFPRCTEDTARTCCGIAWAAARCAGLAMDMCRWLAGMNVKMLVKLFGAGIWRRAMLSLTATIPPSWKAIDLQRCDASDGIKVGILLKKLDVFGDAKGGD